MASNLETLVTVFGGSGFLGRNVVRALCRRDYRVRVAVRRPELAGYLQPSGKVVWTFGVVVPSSSTEQRSPDLGYDGSEYLAVWSDGGTSGVPPR